MPSFSVIYILAASNVIKMEICMYFHIQDAERILKMQFFFFFNVSKNWLCMNNIC